MIACFTKNFALKRHVEKVHEGKTPFNCDICGAKFFRKPNLKGHIASLHEGEKTFRCGTCDTKFSHKLDWTYQFSS